MEDKVSELRKILNKKRSTESGKKEPGPQPPAEGDTPSPPELPEMDLAKDYEDLKKRFEELKKANETQKDLYLRKVAEFENFRKRLQKEQDALIKYSNEKLLEDLLPVIDSLEMTLSHVPNEEDAVSKGVKLILKQFLTALEKHGVKQIAGEGENFDPHLQEAIGTEEVKDTDSGKVIQVHRKGYTLHGKLIRAALVTVSK